MFSTQPNSNIDESRLRALSHGDTPVSPPPSPSLGAPRYKLAQHRYGREEMLALYDKMMKAPDDLTVAPPLYIEKTQLPLALIQMTDEEMVSNPPMFGHMVHSLFLLLPESIHVIYLKKCSHHYYYPSECGRGESTVMWF